MDATRVFEIFKEISDVPRGSYHNEKIGQYLVEFASRLGLENSIDEAGNVLVKKAGTAGYENSEPVILQGHMDIVCETADGYEHDFENEGLDIFVEGDLMGARGTTLGADDGIALAMALAILESDEVSHPPIEALFTTDEEVGMLGAIAFDCGKLNGRQIINIDSEEEGTLLVSCAGGCIVNVSFQPDFHKKSGKQVTLSVSGLLGGHSGTEIHKNRVNASNLLGRILFEIPEDLFEIASFTGGTKDNVITNHAQVVCMVEDIDRFFEYYDAMEEKIVNEISTKEPDLELSIEYRDATDIPVISFEDKKNILAFINQAPSGVQVMSADMEGVVESSLNMGVAVISEEKTEFGFGVRSQKSSYKDYMCEKLENLAKLCNGAMQRTNDYPAWDFNPDSRLRQVMSDVYEKQYGEKPVIMGIHAGLECGVFYENIEHADIVSIGANTYDIHTANERLSISSSERVFAYVLDVLKELK